MHDGIEVERRGKPAAVVCTEPFTDAAHEMARICGIPHYPFAVIRHPMGTATEDERRARAEAALPQIIAILRRQA